MSVHFGTPLQLSHSSVWLVCVCACLCACVHARMFVFVWGGRTQALSARHCSYLVEVSSARASALPEWRQVLHPTPYTLHPTLYTLRPTP